MDRRGAEETKVDFDGQRLTIAGPKPRIRVFGPTESVDVKVELPTGSRLTAEVAVGATRTVGRLGATRIKSSMGPVDVDTTGDLWLRASHGNATLGTAEGGVDITANHGQIRVGTVTGDAILKASHGTIVGRRVRRRPRREALVRRPRDHEGARLRRGEDRVRRHPAARGLERLHPGRERLSARSPSACGPAYRPGSTCPRRTGGCATS